MPPRTQLIIQDPVHGAIGLDRRERAVLDSQAVQRLRRVRQLAGTFLIFPGATHDRLSHSIGAMHVGRAMAHRAGCSASTATAVGLALLVHDVGHGPFSHVSEHVMLATSGAGAQGISQIHPLLSAAKVRHDPELGRALGRLREPVLDLLEGAGSVAHEIVSGAYDADKIDYVARDRYFTGLRIPARHPRYFVDAVQADQRTLTASAAAQRALLRTRRRLQDAVYWRTARVGVDILLQRLLLYGMRSPGAGMGPLFPHVGQTALRGSQISPRSSLYRFSELTDDGCVAAALAAPAACPPRLLAELFVSRRLLTPVCSLPITQGNVLYEMLDQGDAPLRAFEADIASIAGCPPFTVAVHRESESSPTHRIADQYARDPAHHRDEALIVFAPKEALNARRPIERFLRRHLV